MSSETPDVSGAQMLRLAMDSFTGPPGEFTIASFARTGMALVRAVCEAALAKATVIVVADGDQKHRWRATVCMDLEAMRAVLTAGTLAVIPMHLGECRRQVEEMATDHGLTAVSSLEARGAVAAFLGAWPTVRPGFLWVKKVLPDHE